jgi:hypothetical protein
MKTNTHFLSYPAQFFLEREMFQTVGEEIKTHFTLNSFFSPESRAVYVMMMMMIIIIIIITNNMDRTL